MADDPSGFSSFKVRENRGYHEMMMSSMELKHQEAAKDGFGEFYEDVLDSIWSSIPTAEKLTIEIHEEEGKARTSAFDAWVAASALLSAKANREEQLRDPINRRRVNRKGQIITDTLAALDFLYKKPPVGRYVESDGADEISWGDDVE